MKRLALLVWLVSSPLAAAVPGSGIPVSGLVQDADGTPVQGAEVRLVPLPGRAQGWRLELAGRSHPEPVARAASDARGRFRITAPEAGMWRVIVAAPGRVPRQLDLVPLLEARELPPAQLPAGTGLEVQVVDARGEPVAGARLRATEVPAPKSYDPFQETWSPVTGAAVTGADGKAVLAVSRGRQVTVSAVAPGLLPAHEGVWRQTGARLSLKAGCAWPLEVLDDGRKPLEGAVAWLGGLPQDASDAAGRLAVAAPCEEEVVVGIVTGDGREMTVRLPPAAAGKAPAKPVQVPVLPSPPSLTGSVTDAVSRQPVAGALVWPMDDPAAFVRTDARGVYRVTPGTDPSRRTFQAVSPEHLAASETLQRAPGSPPAAPAFVLHPALLVSGAVVDETGGPVPGAELQVLSKSGPMARSFGPHDLPRLRSDSGGLFRLRLPAGASYEVTVRHPGFAPVSAEILALEPRTARSVRIVLERGRTAFGRVVDSDEQPVAGAKVTLQLPREEADPQRSSREDDSRSFEAETDGAGRFELRELPAGRFDLEARSAVHPPVVVRGLALEGAEAEPVDLGTVILPPGAAIEGIVVDSKGKPVAEASLQVNLLGSFPTRHLFHSSSGEILRSGPDGRFTITGLRAGQQVELLGRKEGYLPKPTIVEVPPPGPVRVIIEPGVRIAGQVVGEDGKQISRAEIHVSIQLSPTSRSGMGSWADDQGRFEMGGLEPGALTVRARATGYLPEEKRVEAATGQNIEGLRFVLRKGATVTGRVLGPDGAPVPGAEVQVLVGSSGSFLGDSFPELTTADGEGRYRLEGIAEGRRSLAAEHPGLQRTVKDLDVRPGENRLDLQLGQGFPVAGRVVDTAGRAVEGARVLLHLAPGPGIFREPGEAASGADGAFRFPSVAPASYILQASKDGYAAAEPQERIDVAGGPVEGLELRLALGSGVLRGRILGLDFERLEGVHVTAARAVSPGDYGDVREGRVDFEGSYEIRGMAPGEWVVGAESRGASTFKTITLSEGALEMTLDLEFTGGLTLSGSVLRAGEPVPGINISAGGTDDEDSGYGMTGSRGEFRLEGLEPGVYEITVSDSRSGTYHQEQVDLSGDREIVIELPSTRVSGRVVDATDSSPVAGATVSLEILGGAITGFFTRTTTGASGTFELNSVPEGTWRTVARKDGYVQAEATVEARPGHDVEDVRLALSPGAGLVLEVVAATGNPPQWVSAALQDLSGRTVVADSFEAGEGGRVRIGSAPAGRFRLFVSAAGSATVSLDVTIPGEPVRVVLPPGAQLTIRVPALEDERTIGTLTILDALGQPLRLLSFGSLMILSGFPHAGPSTLLENVPPGTWKIQVTTPDGRVWAETATTAGGRAEVVLE